MTIDLRPNVQRFGKLKTVRRPGVTSFVDGFPQQDDTTERQVMMLIRPMKAEQLRRLTEGDRKAGARRFHSTSVLHVVDVEGAQAGDIVLHEGHEWEVREVDPHIDQGNFWSGTLIRRGR